MKIKFFGTRGSIPVCDKECQEFGGNTPSILLQTENRVGILDAGTGIRQLGKELLACEEKHCDEIYLAFSHFHWDHIQGFPFFQPAYDPEKKLIIGLIGRGSKMHDLKTILETQMSQDYFPLPMTEMGSTIRFMQSDNNKFNDKYFTITSTEHIHPGGAYSYRVEAEGKILVYCTDVEHPNGIDERVVNIAKDADILIHDGQYTPDELRGKKGWGHSSFTQAIEVAKRAKVRKLILTHHDPDHTDVMLHEIENESQKLFDDVVLARDGMEVEI